ncbi:MAG: response regulator [Desulfobulbaceae bacterium]|nr:response regulator [Desulfobulbaceae bacterium]
MTETLMPLKNDFHAAPYNLTKSSHILLAEDEPNNRAMIMFFIQMQGWQVTAVENGREALAEISESEYDLVLMNIRMPEMNGFETLTAIRAMEKIREKHTPIIAVTANAIKGYREKCLTYGFDDYIAKPFRLEDLGQTIKNFLGKPNWPEEGQSGNS